MSERIDYILALKKLLYENLNDEEIIDMDKSNGTISRLSELKRLHLQKLKEEAALLPNSHEQYPKHDQPVSGKNSGPRSFG